MAAIPARIELVLFRDSFDPRLQYLCSVEQGKTNWLIASPANATPTETFAAAELSRYLQQMSGVADRDAGRNGKTGSASDLL